VEKWLWQAADWAGFGAKTSAGYGRFRHFADKAKPKS
jgi:CRISPR/Cas system CMR subunit Cmr6 (Cas7 group RAMP superfamily)